jgi:hypothetical protein
MERTKGLIWWIKGAGLLLALGLAACQGPPLPTTTPSAAPATNTPFLAQTSTPPETGAPVAFETIDQETFGPNVTEILEPRIFWIGNQEQAEQVRHLIKPETYEQLANLDFDQYAAIAAFRGLQSSSGYDIVIQRLLWQDGRLVVHAQLWEPGPGWEVAAIVTFPYHVVSFRRQEGMDETVELALQGQAITPTPPNQTPAAGVPAPEPASQPSPQAQIALQHITEREGIPIEDLGFEERVRSYPNLGKQYVAVSMYDRKSFRTFVVLVGLQDNQVTDLETVEQAEAQAYRA